VRRAAALRPVAGDELDETKEEERPGWAVWAEVAGLQLGRRGRERKEKGPGRERLSGRKLRIKEWASKFDFSNFSSKDLSSKVKDSNIFKPNLNWVFNWDKIK
jgi:hypothetical protein